MFHAFFLGLNDVFFKRGQAEASSTQRPYCEGLLDNTSVAAFVGAFLGCLTTSYLSALGTAPAIASALATTLLCGQVLVIQTTRSLPDELFTAIYGGAFGGMTSVLWFSTNESDPSFWQLSLLPILLAMVCGFAFCIVAVFDRRGDRPLACGYGGRSGAIAAAACIVFAEIASRVGADDKLFRFVRPDAADATSTPAALTFVACLLGTFAVLLPVRRQGLKVPTIADRVFLSATIALIGLTGLHLSGLGDPNTLDAFYAGCFLGMSTPERLKGPIEATLAAVVLAALLVQVKRLLPGIGGSLGLAAFLTVMMFVTLNQITVALARLFRSREGAALTKRTRSSADDEATAEMRPFRSQSSFPERRRMRVSFNVVLAFAAIACLAPAVLFSPEGSVLGTAASPQISGSVVSIAEQPVSLETTANTADNSPSLVMSFAEVDRSDLRMPETLLVADRDAAMAQLKDASDASMPAPSEAKAPLPPPPVINGGATAAKESNEEIFREFLQWRATQSTEIATPAQKPPKKRRSPASQFIGPLAALSSPNAARPQESRPRRVVAPSATRPVEPSSRPIYPRGSVP
jgi:hypothetical protein